MNPQPDSSSEQLQRLKQTIYEASVEQARREAEMPNKLARFFERIEERRAHPKLDLNAEDRAFLKGIGVKCD